MPKHDNTYIVLKERERNIKEKRGWLDLKCVQEA